jgi:hypothetical protein
MMKAYIGARISKFPCIFKIKIYNSYQIFLLCKIYTVLNHITNRLCLEIEPMYEFFIQRFGNVHVGD